jgi:hypothetical protein
MLRVSSETERIFEVCGKIANDVHYGNVGRSTSNVQASHGYQMVIVIWICSYS